LTLPRIRNAFEDNRLQVSHPSKPPQAGDATTKR
jgi:hypothetical protein